MSLASYQEDTTTDYGACLLAVFRMACFFSLCLISVPLYLLAGWFKADSPYLVPMIFYRTLLKIIGFRLNIYGQIALERPTLFVANHASYLDIPVLGALLPATFVAKSEISDWPLFGFMAKLQNTVFIERRIMRTSDQANVLNERLSRKQSLILFPEGTSTNGQSVLPFKSSYFGIAENGAKDIRMSIQPVSVSCATFEGLPVTRSLRSNYSWYGDMTLVKHLWSIFKISRISVNVIFHPAVSPCDFPNRKALASYCHAQVARGIESCITGRLQSDEITPARQIAHNRPTTAH